MLEEEEERATSLTAAERQELFAQIKAYYDAKDRRGLSEGKLPMHSTAHGFWGTTNLDDAFELFTRIRLERFHHFADFGSGDGRVVLVASLFTRATGIEGDHDLVVAAETAREELDLEKLPITFVEGDYMNLNYADFDIIFTFPDHRFSNEMVQKLLAEFRGYLFAYNRVHAPEGIPAGKTYWVAQMPIASYSINVPDANLELDE